MKNKVKEKGVSINEGSQQTQESRKRKAKEGVNIDGRSPGCSKKKEQKARARSKVQKQCKLEEQTFPESTLPKTK